MGIDFLIQKADMLALKYICIYINTVIGNAWQLKTLNWYLKSFCSP